MKCKFIHVMKDKSNININDIKIHELFKLSIGNKINDLYYNKNKKESSNKNLKINYYKKKIPKNLAKMIYKKIDDNKYKKIFNKKFILKNIKRAKIIINNKLNNLKENFENKNHISKIKIKFLDNILYLNSMFEDCKSLSSVYNLKNIIK